ncbi:MAG TPA: lipocalin-like domain-containing protein [Vicinamibacterales bacterium]|nr:lipocalin-like domain-containing protein [Vicinamibacterales bacterium]
MTNRLIGNWRLIAYETVDAVGRRARPYGDAVGRLTYDERGNMSGQVMRPNRARVELGEGNAQQVRAAYMGYIAYFGTYRIDPTGTRVVHRVEGSLNPAWVGSDQVRALRFEGERLVLSAEVLKGGQTVTHTLTWERC